MKKLIQDAYKGMDPDQKQIDKMYNDVLDRHNSKDSKVIVVNHKKKILKASLPIVACAVLTICLGASIYKNAQDLKISKSDNNAVVTEETVSPVTEVSPAPVPAENTVVRDICYPCAFYSNEKILNAKKYYITVEIGEDEYLFENINLSDLTSETVQGSESYSYQGTFISGNTLYSIDIVPENEHEGEKLFLCTTDIASNQITNKTQIDYLYNSICTDKQGKIYLGGNDSDQLIKIYSKDLKLIYSISKEDIISKAIDKITECDPQNMYIDAITVSPEGEIYVGFSNYQNGSVFICKLDSNHNLSFITDNFYDIGNGVDDLYISDNGNIIMCSSDYKNQILYVNEISAQNGQLTRSLGSTGCAHTVGLYDNNIILFNYDTAANGSVFKYNIEDQSTEEIYSCPDDGCPISNAVLNGNTLMVVSYNKHIADETTTLIIEDSDGNIERKIVLDTPLPVSFDVTADEQIYYMTTEYNVVHEKTESYEIGTHSIYTFNSDFQPEKLFDITTSDARNMAPALSADTNGNIYVCVTDPYTLSTLYIYDHSGNIKSTLDLPEVLQAVQNIIVTDSSDTVFVMGLDTNDNYCSVTVDPQTLQIENISNIDYNSAFVYKDGVAAFTGSVTDDDSEENADIETQQTEHETN